MSDRVKGDFHVRIFDLSDEKDRIDYEQIRGDDKNMVVSVKEEFRPSDHHFMVAMQWYVDDYTQFDELETGPEITKSSLKRKLKKQQSKKEMASRFERQKKSALSRTPSPAEAASV